MEPLRLASLWSRALAGAKAIPVAVEVHLGNGLPQFQIVGLPDLEVRESRERVRVAILSSGFEFPQRRITVSLAPADLPKESARFDLPIAIGILLASGQLPATGIAGIELAGELGLDGKLRPVRGGLAMAVAARNEKHRLVLPFSSACEASVFAASSILAAESLRDVCRHLIGEVTLASGASAVEGCLKASAPPQFGSAQHAHSAEGPMHGKDCADLRDVRGQAVARRALEVAAAGGHSLLLHGPPGCGKTLLADRLASILPPLTEEEALNHAINRSLAGCPVDADQRYVRPFRRPHHTTPALALTGGGTPLRPGEMTLAHSGVLFLDELPEFSRQSMESLREPLETGCIQLSRVSGSAVFDAHFQLVGTMNPCPCGRPRDGIPACRCRPEQVLKYRARLSQPLLDRIDLWVPVDYQAAEVLTLSGSEDSATVRARAMRARQVQLDRQGQPNAALNGSESVYRARLSARASRLWQQLANRHRLSSRGAHRLLRVARTLADLTGSDDVQEDHLHSASAWRLPF